MKRKILGIGLIFALLAAALLLTACGSMKATCTVTFNSNGGSEVPAQRVAKGEKMEKPEDPQKTGYALSGWAYQGEAWSFVGYTVTENMTLDAVWTPVRYSISYELNGGSTQNPAYYTIEEDDFTLSNATRADYEFIGWTWDGQAEPVIHPVIARGSFGNKTFIANWKPRLFTVSDNSIIGLTDVGKKLSTIEIPSEIEGVAITSIGEYAFYYCTGLTSVTIPDSVTSIGSASFSGCYHLVEVRNLSSLNITAGSSDYGYAGYYAKRVYKDGESYLHTTDDGFVFYDDGTNVWLVKHNGTATNLTLPASYNSKQYAVNQYAFWGCTGLTSVTIGSGVTSIGNSAFSGCTGLTSVTIPDSATSIGERAFSDCYRLVEVRNLSALNITAGSSNYGYAGSYAKRVYKDGESYLHTTDDGFVFYDDGTNVWLVKYNGTETDLTLPTSYNGKQYAVNRYAFWDCTGLTSITIPNSVTSIGSSAFSYCTGLTNITFAGTKAQWDAISKGSGWNSNTRSYTIHCTDGDIQIPWSTPF